MLIHLWPLFADVRSATACGLQLCLPWINYIQTTPGSYKITQHASTRIRRMRYKLVFCNFMSEMLDTGGH